MHVIAEAAAGPFAAACVVLAFAGVSKIPHPLATQPAAAALRLPSSRTAVRALGVVEVAIGVAGLAVGGPAAAAVAITYAALAFAAWRLLLRAPGTACGCLGASDAPVTRAHVIVNVAAALASALAVGAGAPLGVVGPGLWSRVVFVVLVGCCAWLVTSVVEVLPSLNTSVREGGVQ